jgi:hypothetical protein
MSSGAHSRGWLRPGYGRCRLKDRARVMTAGGYCAVAPKHTFAISRLDTPELCHLLPALSNQRAQGMPGARCARSRAWCVESTRPSVGRDIDGYSFDLGQA